MPRINAVVETPVLPSFRVEQVGGMFDVPPAERFRESFEVELPADDEDWSIGCIVGPSGSGKSTIARHAWPQTIASVAGWKAGEAVIDGVGGSSIKAATQTLTAVGLGSPPSWLKPYHVLSGGEQFRCDLARALLSERSMIVFDEFTSVVDRNVARIGSAAVAKAIRSGKLAKRFVAVSCHYDILPWLSPDWTLDMSDQSLARRRLRRPSIHLTIYRVHHSAWQTFRRHHYLDNTLHNSAHCYVAFWNDEPVAFCGIMNVIGRKNRRRISRLVVLPDYQGVGIGGRLMNVLAERYRQTGQRMNITTGHPAMIRSLDRSPTWRAVGFKPTGFSRHSNIPLMRTSLGRTVASFEYLGEQKKSPSPAGRGSG